MHAYFRLLGPAAISVGDATVTLPSNKPCVVLATLLLHANQPVSTDRLHQAIWGESPPGTARATLQTYVLRLRQLLHRHAIASCLIRTVPGGYTVEASAESLDVLRFRELARTARAHAASGDLDSESACLSEALALWSGQPLAGVDSDLLHREEVPKLVEERLELVERRMDVEIACGRHRGLVSELRSLTGAHPQRERFAEQLMAALYLSGRQGEALDEYRRVKDTLLDELGIDPGPGLRRLELTILRGDDLDVAPTVPMTVLSVPPLTSVPIQGRPDAARDTDPEPSCQLPLDVPSLVGRDALAADLTAQLVGPAGRTEPVIAMVNGVPGVGKTALAVRVAHRVRAEFPDGQWYVRLTAADGTAREPASVLSEFLRLLGEDPARLPRRTSVLAAAYRAAMASRRVLLVLDDADSVDQVQPLLPGASASSVLITSRQGLACLTALWGIRASRIGPLDRCASVELLARMVGDDVVAADPVAAAELAELCGRLPLALRIAAARLLRRDDRDLAEHVRWLTSNTLAKLAIGQVSVRDAFDTVFDRLGEGARAAFGLVGAHCLETGGGDITVDHVAARLGVPDYEAEELLDQLYDASLLTNSSPGRFGVSGLLRLYASDKAFDGAAIRLAEVQGG